MISGTPLFTELGDLPVSNGSNHIIDDCKGLSPLPHPLLGEWGVLSDRVFPNLFSPGIVLSRWVFRTPLWYEYRIGVATHEYIHGLDYIVWNASRNFEEGNFTCKEEWKEMLRVNRLYDGYLWSDPLEAFANFTALYLQYGKGARKWLYWNEIDYIKHYLEMNLPGNIPFRHVATTNK